MNRIVKQSFAKCIGFTCIMMMLSSMTVSAQSTVTLTSSTGEITLTDGQTLTGTGGADTRVTLANNASITLNNATIEGGVVCAGNATIIIEGTNTVSVPDKSGKAGIQIGPKNTTLTIKGSGSLNIDLSQRAGGAAIGTSYGQSGGNIVIESGIITAIANRAAGIGLASYNYNAGINKMGDITIKGGTITAIGNEAQNGIGKTEDASEVGQITIYSGVDLIDALGGWVSGLGENVKYMNDDKDVTDDKESYFTIGEIRPRIIIAPKSNTDYTVTVANNIENGSITVQPTAKFGESVILTVTPAFGYRLQSLSVKDADNNSVEVANKMFFMPQGGVTVNAEFVPYNTHGNTEFTLKNNRNTIATIYEGINTVNIQQRGKYYQIWNSNKYGWVPYLNELSVNLPFSESGLFDNFEDGLEFFLSDNSSENGFYDIILLQESDVRWFLSFSKTVPIIDAIPDQEYTGNAITPEPLVIAGSLNLTKYTNYYYSYSDNINVGTAKVIVTFKGDYESLGSVEKEFTIKKALTSSNVADIADQTYNGSVIEPEVTVTNGETTLTRGTDYTVTYIDNINAGIATAKITGIGNYMGTIEKTFTINHRVTTSGALTLTEYGNRTTAEIQGDFSNTSSEDKPLEISEPIPVNKVTFKRSFTAGIPATIMLPFGFTPDGDNIGSFYTLKSVECKNGEWIATMSEAVNYVTANTPYIFKAAKNLTELSFEDEVGITLQPTSDIKENPNGDWTLHGVYAYTLLYGNEQINYGFAGRDVKDDGISVGDFIRAGKGVWADPMRCYLTYSGDDTRLKSKAATVLPDRIRVVFPDEVEDEPSDTEIITPVTETVTESVVKVWSYNKTVIIESQPGTDYTIVDLFGRILKTGVTHSTHEEVTVNLSTGIVIVIINDKSFKLNY